MAKVFAFIKYLIVFIIGAIMGILTFVKVVGKILAKVDGINDFKKSFIDILTKAMLGDRNRYRDGFQGYSAYYHHRGKRPWESEDTEDTKGDTI